MIRIIILLTVTYVLYRALKSWMFPAPRSSENLLNKAGREIDDVMVKDPYCEAYFPKRHAVTLNFDGEELLFCSAKCKDKYLAAHSENTD